MIKTWIAFKIADITVGICFLVGLFALFVVVSVISTVLELDREKKYTSLAEEEAKWYLTQQKMIEENEKNGEKITEEEQN